MNRIKNKTVRKWLLFILVITSTNSLHLSAQVFLNAGQIEQEPILIESKRILINCRDRISFWDIDKSILLKEYTTNNLYSSGLPPQEIPQSVSPKENYFVTVTPDSIFIYDIGTQERKSLSNQDNPFKMKRYCGFSTDEDFFVASSASGIRAWQVNGWKEINLEEINKTLDTDYLFNGEILLTGNDLVFSKSQNKISQIHFANAQYTYNEYQIDSVPSDFSFQINILPSSKAGSLILYKTTKYPDNKTWMALYNVPEHALEKKMLLPFYVQWSFNGGNNNLVFVPAFKKSLPFYIVNTETGATIQEHFTELDSAAVSRLSYPDFFCHNAHFMIRSSIHNLVAGINLNSGIKYTIDDYLNYSWLGIINDSLLVYRTKKEREQGLYTFLNTYTDKSKQLTTKDDLLFFHPFSKKKDFRFIHKESPARYILYRQKNEVFVPSKLIENTAAIADPSTCGKLGSHYIVALNLVDYRSGNSGESEFVGDGFTNGSGYGSVFNGTAIRYLDYDLSYGRGVFVESRNNLITNFQSLRYSANITTKKNEWGFDETDSVFFVDNANQKLIASMNKKTADSMFSYRLSSFVANYGRLHQQLNKTATKFIFHDYYSNVSIISIDNKNITRVDPIDISKLHNNTYVTLEALGFCNNDQNFYCISKPSNGYYLDVFDAATNKHIHTSSYGESYGLDIKTLNSSSLYIVSNRDKKQVWVKDFLEKGFSKEIDWKNKTYLFNSMETIVSPAGTCFAMYEGTGAFFVYDTKGVKLICKDSFDNIKPIRLTDNGFFYFLNTRGFPCMFDIHKHSVHEFSSGIFPATKVYSTLLADNDSLLVTTGMNAVYFWNTKTRRLQQEVLLIDSSKIFTINDKGHYSTEKSNISEVLYRKGTQVSSINLMDVAYNNPATFVIPHNDEQKIYKDALEQAYKKRIKKYNTITANTENSILLCNILNRNKIESFTADKYLTLHVAIIPGTSTVNKLHITINEVPIFGWKGLSVKPAKELDTTITIVLNEGKNKIAVWGTAENGSHSNQFPLTIEYSHATNVLPIAKLHFIGIGINQFADKQYNLNWSVKDIRDLGNKLKEKYRDNIEIDTLFDEKVNILNIQALKSKLLRTNVNDKVVIAYSGHGLLNKSYDYYLSTYRINFNKPEENGLSYDELEELLDSIPARQKLMLIDACHSGEVDKEEMTKIESSQKELAENGVTTKSTIKVVPNKNTGMTNSIELMQTLFVNVGKSTGATIISAAGGMQYAQERGDLKNGVFTYSIIEAFNKNATLKISELKKLVGERVVQLTNGLQKPTSRNETNNYDWTIW